VSNRSAGWRRCDGEDCRSCGRSLLAAGGAKDGDPEPEGKRLLGIPTVVDRAAMRIGRPDRQQACVKNGWRIVVDRAS
jgi:hypothetical protein